MLTLIKDLSGLLNINAASLLQHISIHAYIDIITIHPGRKNALDLSLGSFIVATVVAGTEYPSRHPSINTAQLPSPTSCTT
jgi:hypothetical protein